MGGREGEGLLGPQRTTSKLCRAPLRVQMSSQIPLENRRVHITKGSMWRCLCVCFRRDMQNQLPNLSHSEG